MGPSTRSATGNKLSKKMLRKSKRLERINNTAAAGPLRRSERRSKNLPSSSATSIPAKGADSSSPGSKRLNPKKKAEPLKGLKVDDEERDVGSSSKVNNKRSNAAKFGEAEEDSQEEPETMDGSTQEGGNSGGEEMLNDGKLPSDDDKAKEMITESRLNEPAKGLSDDNVALGSSVPSYNATNHEDISAPDEDQSDCHGEQASEMLVSTDSGGAKSRLNGLVKELSENNATLSSSVPSNAITHKSNGTPESDKYYCHKKVSSPLLNESWIRNCTGHDTGENLISSKRKGSMMDMQPDVSVTLADDGNSHSSGDADPSRLCENTTGTSGSCSKRIRQISLSDEQLGQRKLIHNISQLSPKIEGVKLSTGNKEERPQGNDIEDIRIKQRSLHLLLKPEIAKLCEILHLPDNVKNMVDHCLQYVMNNRQICTEPASILQAFQLSLCWVAASLLNHKLDFEASVKLAKRHLNFICKKAMVDEIYSMLWKLKDEILFNTGNPDVTDPLKASESSTRAYSYTELAPEIELVKNNSNSTKEIHQCENQLEKLLLVQKEEKHKLKADIEKQKADFVRRYKLEYAAICCCSPNDSTRRKKLVDFNKEYDRRLRELKWQHAKRFTALEARQQEAIWKCEESNAPKLLNLGASKQLESRFKSLLTSYQAQPPNGPKNETLVSGHVIEGKSSDNIVESMTRAGSWVELSESPDTNSSVVLVCSSPVELQTPIVKHADATGMDIMASEDSPESSKKCHSTDEKVDVVSKHSNYSEQCSAGSASMVDEGEGCKIVSCESHNDENAAQNHAPDGCIDSNNGNAHNPSSNERIASVNFKSPQVSAHSPNGMSLQNFEDSTQIYEAGDGICSNNDVTQNSTLVDDGAIVSLSDREVHLEMPGTGSFSHCPETVYAMNPSSMQHISGSEIIMSTLDRESSRPCQAACPSNFPCSNQLSLEKQNPDGVSSRVPAEQITIEVPETGYEGASVSISDRDSPAEMTGTVNCSDYPENVTPLNSSLSPISEKGSVLDGILSSKPSGASSPSHALATMPPLNMLSSQQLRPHRVSDEQLAVKVSETGREVTECQLTETMMVDRSTTSDQQDGMPRTMAGNTLPVEAPVSVSAQSPPDPDSARETENSFVSGTVDIEQANQSSQLSVVVEPPERVQVLPCGEFPPSKQDLSSFPSETEIQHQQTNDDSHSSHIPEAPVEVPTQGIDQLAFIESDQVSVIVEPSEQVQGLPCGESPPSNQDLSNLPSATEIQHQQTNDDSHSSCIPEASVEIPTQEIETQGIDQLVSIESNQVSVIVEPPEQVQGLPCSESPPSNQDLSNLPSATEIQHQQTNDDSHSSLIPEASVEVPTQGIETQGIDQLASIGSNQVSVIVEPPEQVQGLPCGESPPSNQDLSSLPSATEIQHQQTNDNRHSIHIPEASVELPTQGVDQLASNLELDSCLHPVFVHPALNLELDLPMPGGVGRQSADPRNLSTTSEIRNHSVQTAIHPGSRTAMPFSHDPLRNELEIIRKMAEQNMKNYEETKLRLQSDLQKEMEELRRKYLLKYRGNEVEFQQQKKELDTRYKTVSLNKALAEAFRLTCTDYKASGMQQDQSYTRQLLQLFQQQNASTSLQSTTRQCTSTQTIASPPHPATQTMVPPPTQPYTTTQTMVPPPTQPHTTTQVMASPPTRPHTTTQTMASPPTRPHTTISSQTVVPGPKRPHTRTDSPAMAPLLTRPYTTTCSQTPPTRTAIPPSNRTAYNTFRVFSGVSARLPHTNSIPSPSGNFQATGEIRSPAPHLQHCRPSTSVPASSQPAPGNIAAHRSSFSDLLLSVLPKPNHPGPVGPFPASTGGLPTPNLSAMNSCMDANNQSGINPSNALLPNAPPRMSKSESASIDTITSRMANLSHQATSNVVCLSDDD